MGHKGGGTGFLIVAMASRKEGGISFPQLCFQRRKDECPQGKRGLARGGVTAEGVEQLPFE